MKSKTVNSGIESLIQMEQIINQQNQKLKPKKITPD